MGLPLRVALPDIDPDPGRALLSIDALIVPEPAPVSLSPTQQGDTVWVCTWEQKFVCNGCKGMDFLLVSCSLPKHAVDITGDERQTCAKSRNRLCGGYQHAAVSSHSSPPL